MKKALLVVMAAFALLLGIPGIAQASIPDGPQAVHQTARFFGYCGPAQGWTESSNVQSSVTTTLDPSPDTADLVIHRIQADHYNQGVVHPRDRISAVLSIYGQPESTGTIRVWQPTNANDIEVESRFPATQLVMRVKWDVDNNLTGTSGGTNTCMRTIWLFHRTDQPYNVWSESDLGCRNDYYFTAGVRGTC